jgi:hypothetical protein
MMAGLFSRVDRRVREFRRVNRAAIVELEQHEPCPLCGLVSPEARSRCEVMTGSWCYEDRLRASWGRFGHCQST